MLDYYDIMGVPRDASLDAIKRAFKQHARELHPDRNASPVAETRFKKISAAYEALSDPRKRALYDEFGEIALKAGFDEDAARASRGQSPYQDPGSWFGSNDSGQGDPGMSFSDIFGGLFNEGHGTTPYQGSAREERPQREPDPPPDWQTRSSARPDNRVNFRSGPSSAPPARGPDNYAKVEVDLVAAVKGSEVSVALNDGRAVRVRLPEGVESGQTIRVGGKGGAGFRGGAAGDLLLDVKVRPHPHLRRLGQDLEMDVPLTLKEAMLGGPVTVPTPWARLRVKVPPGVRSGSRLRVRGKGMRAQNGQPAGDLYMVLRPVLPDSDDPRAVKLASELEAFYTRDPRSALDF